MHLFKSSSHSRGLAPNRRRAQVWLEPLESRIVPDALSGDAWPNPNMVTLSLEPDGTNLGGQSSNLFSTFNSKWATSTWQNVILEAAQVWAMQTNINFSVISDNGAPMGAGNYQQGSYRIGDIRIGGFGMGSSPLAEAAMPPPVNNFSVAGDMQFNTSSAFNIGSDYDLFTVATHEMGHALGLLHSTDANAAMYGTYNGVKSYGVNSDDIAGIRSIYSSGQARSTDQYGGLNSSFATAANINSLIDQTNLTAVVNPLDIYTPGFTEFLTFNNPQNTSSTLTITAQSSGLSLLAPSLTVYNYLQQQVAYVSGAGQYGTTISVTLQNIHAGRQIYVAVAGAESSPFGTGNYAMTFQWGSTPPPPVNSPIVQVPNGNPLQSGGGVPDAPPVVFGSPSLHTVVSGALPANLSPLTLPKMVTVTPAQTVAAPVQQAALAGPRIVESGASEIQEVPAFETGYEDQAKKITPDPFFASSNQTQAQPGQVATQAKAPWRQASAACFASTGQGFDLVNRRVPVTSAQQDDWQGQGLDHAAAILSMALILGSYWAPSPEQRTQREGNLQRRSKAF